MLRPFLLIRFASGEYKLQHATTTGLPNPHFGVLNPYPDQTFEFGCSSCTAGVSKIDSWMNKTLN